MLVLVATTETQGALDGDYFHSVDGEVVTPVAVECCSSDACACGAGFPGLASSRATTTALVAARPGITPDVLRQAIADSLARRGGQRRHVTRAELDEVVEAHLEAISDVCGEFPVGTVVRRTGEMVVAHDAEFAA